MAKTRSAQDRELDAMKAIIQALDGLEGESIQRVMDYVFSSLSIAAPKRQKVFSPPDLASAMPSEPAHRVAVQSIRDLKEQKLPEKSSQMAALVAYYLAEIAEGDERKDVINTADIVRYFKQAGYKLPQAPAQTLPKAESAGYLDGVGNGMFKLTPAGYKLVAHGLPPATKVTTKVTTKVATPSRKKSKTRRK